MCVRGEGAWKRGAREAKPWAVGTASAVWKLGGWKPKGGEARDEGVTGGAGSYTHVFWACVLGSLESLTELQLLPVLPIRVPHDISATVLFVLKAWVLN